MKEFRESEIRRAAKRSPLWHPAYEDQLVADHKAYHKRQRDEQKQAFWGCTVFVVLFVIIPAYVHMWFV